MSQLLAAAEPSAWVQPDDRRAVGEHWQQFPAEVRQVGELGDQRTPWWPGSAMGFVGDSTVDMGMQTATATWGFYDLSRGCVSRFGVRGVTRDVYGSPLPFATVKLYQTSSDLMVGSVVSDANGNFTVTTPFYPDQHYMVTYKAGSPDVFGTSPNTLVAG